MAPEIAAIDLAPGYHLRRTAEHGSAEARRLVVQRHLQEIAAMAADRRGRAGPAQQEGNGGAGHRAGAAGQSLRLDAALIGAHAQLAAPELEEIRIAAGGESGMGPK